MGQMGNSEEAIYLMIFLLTIDDLEMEELQEVSAYINGGTRSNFCRKILVHQ